jgi:HK97 family phage prohead protease
MSNTTGPFRRAFPALVERTGPRELSGRLVPYNESADVVDFVDGVPELYREGFRPGVFGRQSAGAKGIIAKIGLVHRHDGGLGYLGPFVALREAPDGLYGAVRILPTLAENVGALLDEGIDELSVEFRLAGSENTVLEDGVRWRTRAHLDQVALEPMGAYSSARVLSYRAAADEQQQEQAAEQQRQAAEDAERVAAEEAARLAAEAEAAADAEAAERRRAWNELSERLPAEQERQKQLVREYGVTKPGGMGSNLR